MTTVWSHEAKAAEFPDIMITDPESRVVRQVSWCGFGLLGGPMRFLLLLAASLCCYPATGQSLFEVPMGAQTQMHVGGDGRVESCGMRVTGLHFGTPTMRVFDTSLTVRKEGRGFGKITGQEGPVAGGVEGLRPVSVYGGWFRAEGKPPTMPLNSYFDGDTPKSKLFIADWEPTLEVLAAIMSGLPIQLAISWEQGTSAIYFGIAEVDDAQKRQFSNCMSDLAAAMEMDG